MKVAYFDPLCLRLGLSERPLESGPGYAIASADGPPVRIFLDYERGLGYFAIGSIEDAQRLCSIDDIAAFLPSGRQLVGGNLRLSLEEQANLLRTYWPTLAELMSESNLPATRASILARRIARTSRPGKAAN